MSSPKRRSTRMAPLALALLGALALAIGCGGDDDSDPTSSTPVAETQPPEQLVEQADAICAEVKESRPPAPPISGQEPNAADLKASVDYFETDLQLTTDVYDQLVELSPPEGLEAQWDVVLDAFKGGVIDNYPALIAAAEEGDPETFLAAVETIRVDTEDLATSASEVGLQVCAAG